MKAEAEGYQMGEVFPQKAPEGAPRDGWRTQRVALVRDLVVGLLQRCEMTEVDLMISVVPCRSNFLSLSFFLPSSFSLAIVFTEHLLCARSCAKLCGYYNE